MMQTCMQQIIIKIKKISAWIKGVVICSFCLETKMEGFIYKDGKVICKKCQIDLKEYEKHKEIYEAVYPLLH